MNRHVPRVVLEDVLCSTPLNNISFDILIPGASLAMHAMPNDWMDAIKAATVGLNSMPVPWIADDRRRRG